LAKRLNAALTEQDTREPRVREPRQDARDESRFVDLFQCPATGGKGRLGDVGTQSELFKRHALEALRKRD